MTRRGRDGEPIEDHDDDDQGVVVEFRRRHHPMLPASPPPPVTRASAATIAAARRELEAALARIRSTTEPTPLDPRERRHDAAARRARQERNDERRSKLRSEPWRAS